MAGRKKRAIGIAAIVLGLAAAAVANLMTCRRNASSAPPTPVSRATVVRIGPVSSGAQSTTGSGSLRLEGQVIDDQQRPVAGAGVELLTKETKTVASDADG